VKQSRKQSLQKYFGTLMNGRNGMDQLSRFMLYLSLFLLIVSIILFSLLNKGITIATIIQYAAIAVLVLSYARAFSHNVKKRSKENLRFLQIVNPINQWFHSKRYRLEMRKSYKFFTCPGCKATLRVPKGKGRINLTCPKCQTKFEGKS